MLMYQQLSNHLKVCQKKGGNVALLVTPTLSKKCALPRESPSEARK